jgi:hypothetical protein
MITPLPQRGRGVRGEGRPQRLAPHAQQRERAADGGTKRWPLNTTVAEAWYLPNKKSGLLIRRSDE